MRSRLSAHELSAFRREITAARDLSPVVFCSTTFSILHIIYEGVLKEFVELTFQALQKQVSVLDFNNVG